MKRRTLLKLVGVSAVAEGLAIACGGAATPSAAPSAAATTASTAAATEKATGRISVYSALNDSTNNELFGAFTKATGVQVDALPLAAAGELQTRITAEKASPKADIFVGGSSEFHDPLGQQGLLEPYISPNAKDLKPEFKDAKGNWTGWYTGIFAFISNNDRLQKELGGKKPATWDDLVDPAWKGKLILPDPIKTGGGYIFIVTQIFRFNRDETKAMDYLKKLHGNIAQYIATSPGALTLIDQGQFVGCPNWAHDILTEKSKGNPVELTIPADTGFEVGAVSIVKGAKNLPAAKAFVDWVLTPEAGALNVKLSNRGSTIASVAPAAGAPKLADVKLVNYDRPWASDTANKTRILQLWQKTVGL
jgi:iron(III) transport system substrate-binding protein